MRRRLIIIVETINFDLNKMKQCRQNVKVQFSIIEFAINIQTNAQNRYKNFTKASKLIGDCYYLPQYAFLPNLN